jgi:hypothetical protein
MCTVHHMDIKTFASKIINPALHLHEKTAHIVQFIFHAFLQNTPLNEIRKQANTLGFNQKSNSSITRILTNKIYTGLIHVKAYKEYPEEWVRGIHIPIIDHTTFNAVQQKLVKKNPKQIINDAMPLRGVLKCWCNQTTYRRTINAVKQAGCIIIINAT